MDYRSVINKELTEASTVLQQFISAPDTVANIQRASSIIAGALIQGGKVISCGNGGSHCDAMHFAEELSGRYRDDRKALAVICISDPSHITCVGNDYGFEFIFSRYIEGLGRKDDVLLALSTSGNSKNVINAADAAKKAGYQPMSVHAKTKLERGETDARELDSTFRRPVADDAAEAKQGFVLPEIEKAPKPEAPVKVAAASKAKKEEPEDIESIAYRAEIERERKELDAFFSLQSFELPNGGQEAA